MTLKSLLEVVPAFPEPVIMSKIYEKEGYPFWIEIGKSKVEIPENELNKQVSLIEPTERGNVPTLCIWLD